MNKFNDEVDAEIKKHQWIESEKIGKDIGVMTARRDWLINHWGTFKSNFDQKETEIVKDSDPNE